MLSVSLFNVARYLTDSLRGPLLQTLRRARKREFDGVGWGGTEYVLGSLIFFKLCKYIDKVYIYLFTH